MRRLLVDTNVLVDYAIGQEPTCSHCRKIISYAAEGNIAAYVAIQSLKDVYYLVGVRLKALEKKAGGEITEEFAQAAKEVAWAFVRQIGEQLHIVSAGCNEHEQAFVYRALHDDYEDNLALAAAQSAKVDLLVTNDKALKSHSPMAALTSGETAALLDAEFAEVSLAD